MTIIKNNSNDISIQSCNTPPLLSNKQARIFSTAIAPDISKYIADNQAEFEAWLKNQEQMQSKNQTAE